MCFFLMELNTRVGGGFFKKVQDDGAICSLLYTDLSTWNNDGIRKCSFMVPEYNFGFLSFVCAVVFWGVLSFLSCKRRLSGRRFVYINENVS